jgi:phosphoglycerate dehydrogenase-like enzyme
MRILLADGLDKQAQAALKQDGHELDVASGLDGPGLIERLEGVEVLVVRSATKVRRDALEQAKGTLNLIIRAGSGLDTIDVAAAEEFDIRVTNTPGLNAHGVAELAVGLMFAVARRVGYGHAGMTQGRWEKKTCKGTEITGKRLGVIGLGTIGKKVVDMGRALGMEVVGARSSERREEGDPPLVSIQEMFETCDIVSLHVPKSPQTTGMVDAGLLANARQGLILINTARGTVVDLDAVLRALEEGRLGGYGVDVYPEEPPPDHALFHRPEVVCTPHIGAQTAESTARIGQRVVEIVREM